MRTGRPTIFAEETATEIIERLAGGESLRGICQDAHLPNISTVIRWLGKHPEFCAQYARARETWAESEFERMMEIADTVTLGERTKVISEGVDDAGNPVVKSKETVRGDMIERAKLQVDTRKWALARMSPKKYGDRWSGELSGKDGKPLFRDLTRERQAMEEALAELGPDARAKVALKLLEADSDGNSE